MGGEQDNAGLQELALYVAIAIGLLQSGFSALLALLQALSKIRNNYYIYIFGSFVLAMIAFYYALKAIDAMKRLREAAGKPHSSRATGRSGGTRSSQAPPC